MVIHRIEDTMALVASIEAHRESLVAALAERYAPQLADGEVLPDWGLELDLTVRELLAALKRLVDLDDRADSASVERELLRRKRDRLVSDDIYPRVVSVRGSIDLAFGRERGRTIHLMKGRTDRTSWGLARQLRLMVNRLADPAYELPPAANPHVPVDREGWVRELKPRHDELVMLIDSFGLSGRAVEGAVYEKRVAMETFDADYGDTLRHLQALFRRARFGARLVRNLRPYYQRRRLARRARKARQARAAATAAGAAAPAPEETRPPREERETARAPVPQNVAEWLKRRLRLVI